MTKLIDKAVGLEDMTHALNVIELLERTYPGPEWPGAMLFQDLSLIHISEPTRPY